MDFYEDSKQPDHLLQRILKQVRQNGEQATTWYGRDGDHQCAEAIDNRLRTTAHEPGSFVPLLRLEQQRQAVDPLVAQLHYMLAKEGIPLPDEHRPAVKDLSVACFHTDHLGTPLRLTGDQGQTLWQGQADDWAAIGQEQGETDQPIRFQGQYRDEESGLYYNRYRYYAPELGRYVTQDPIGLEGGVNTYEYVLGNPLSFSDPLGLEVYICTRPINVSWVPSWASKYLIPNHTWVKTDTAERGMGGDCAVPGQGCADVPYVTEVKVIDHSGQSMQSDATCQRMNNVDEQCVNNGLQLGRDLGVWNGFNQCQSFAWSLVTSCRTGPQL